MSRRLVRRWRARDITTVTTRLVYVHVYRDADGRRYVRLNFLGGARVEVSLP